MYRQYLQLITTEAFSGGDFWVPLDSSVEPGRSYQGVIGTEWNPSRRYQLSVEAYYTDLANLVVLDNAVAVDSEGTRSDDIFKSGGSGWASGVEVFLQRRTGALTGWIGYTLGWTRRTFPELNSGTRLPPKYDRRHDLSFVISYNLGKWRLGSNLVYATGQTFTPASARYSLREPTTGIVQDYVLPANRNSARLLPYHRLDASASREFGLWGTRCRVLLANFQYLQPAQRVVRAVQHEQSRDRAGGDSSNCPSCRRWVSIFRFEEKVVRYVFIILCLTACAAERQPGDLFGSVEEGSELVVDGVLLVDQPLPELFVRRTLPPGQTYRRDAAGVPDAQVRVFQGDQVFEYAPDPARPAAICHR